MWGYCIKNPHNGSDIHPERHISAGIVLPSTSASFCLNFYVFFEKIKFFSRSQTIITWVCKLWLIKVITVIPVDNVCLCHNVRIPYGLPGCDTMNINYLNLNLKIINF